MRDADNPPSTGGGGSVGEVLFHPHFHRKAEVPRSESKWLSRVDEHANLWNFTWSGVNLAIVRDPVCFVHLVSIVRGFTIP